MISLVGSLLGSLVGAIEIIGIVASRCERGRPADLNRSWHADPRNRPVIFENDWYAGSENGAPSLRDAAAKTCWGYAEKFFEHPVEHHEVAKPSTYRAHQERHVGPRGGGERAADFGDPVLVEVVADVAMAEPAIDVTPHRYSGVSIRAATFDMRNARPAHLPGSLRQPLPVVGDYQRSWRAAFGGIRLRP
ncbi:hypothetical protein [Sphingomonas sp. PP-CE-3A-406]|uniref:hypothetical protein n=1 Tax=Sphingomonas sp. PP-CE-3A-406 TaxID=2135659 RepID=UPI0011C46DD4|nr:hypothetical protein [Sphingomonas sp. PP-CE-3A-406]